MVIKDEVVLRKLKKFGGKFYFRGTCLLIDNPQKFHLIKFIYISLS
jgi:hypothetical protein